MTTTGRWGFEMSAIIEIEPTHVTGTGQRYRVWHDGNILIESARSPETEAARALSENGVTGRLRTVRKGRTGYDTEGLISVLAALTVSESQTGTPRFAKWTPYEGEQS